MTKYLERFPDCNVDNFGVGENMAIHSMFENLNFPVKIKANLPWPMHGSQIKSDSHSPSSCPIHDDIASKTTQEQELTSTSTRPTHL
jgi:hypothetical protein